MAAGAAFMDMRRAKVDNMWLLFWLCVCLAIRLAEGGPGALIEAAAGLAVPAAILFPFFCFRMIGAGDVKTLAVAGGACGAGGAARCMLISFLLAAAYSLFVLVSERRLAARIRYFLGYSARYLATGVRVPYADGRVRPESIHMTVPVFFALMIMIAARH